MKKIFFIILAIIIVILVFSLGSFGVEADAVMSGYESTRRYAQNSKMMTVAVDTYKEIVKVKADDEKRRQNAVPNEVPKLGSYGILLSDEDYEKYTDGIFMSPDEKYYLGKPPITEQKSLAAKMNTTDNEWSSPVIINYFTDTNKPCSSEGTNELLIDNGGTRQCAAFADVYMNQIVYDSLIICGSENVQPAINSYTDTYWYSATGATLNSVDEAKSFFKDVTPGTLVRTWAHSYIVLGADDSGIVFYDANTHHDCGIELHRSDWEDFTNMNYHESWATKISTVLSPPDTQLPQGCQDKFGAVGTIINAKEGS